jgi:hypothetical protein
MPEQEPVGKIIVFETDVRLNDKNEWEAVLHYVHKRSFDLIKWEERKLAIRSINKNESMAVTEAQMVLGSQLALVNYDLFSVDEKELLHD